MLDEYRRRNIDVSLRIGFIHWSLERKPLCPSQENKLEQGDSLSGVHLGVTTIAYIDILLHSIGPVYNIYQTQVKKLLKGLRIFVLFDLLFGFKSSYEELIEILL